MTHTTPADYAPYEARAFSSPREDAYVDECRKLRDQLHDFDTDDTEEMPLTSKLLLLAFTFLMGFFVAMQIGA